MQKQSNFENWRFMIFVTGILVKIKNYYVDKKKANTFI